MKNELNKLCLGLVTILVTLLATASFAQTEQTENSSIPLTAEELSEITQELATEPAHKCTLEILKGKRAENILKVKQDYQEFMSVEGSLNEWKKLSKDCSLGDAYYDILVNANGQTGNTLYRMRHVSYLYTAKLNTKFYFYSPAMTQQEMNAYTASVRSLNGSKSIDMGALQATESFHKVTVKGPNGKEMVLMSLENRLTERTLECQQLAKPNEETPCESLGYSLQLNWIYNNFISYMIIESMEDSKYDASVNRIVAIGNSKIESIKDIRDMFSEASLLAALKQDWIIRNSNKWTHFAKAQSWDGFWNFKAEQYYGPVTSFQSYSNKLDKAQVSKVMACAQLAGKNTETNSGFACVQSKKAPTMYMFDYRMMGTTVQNGFDVKKMDENSVYVRIPLMADSTGTAALSLALPKKSSDLFKVLSKQ